MTNYEVVASISDIEGQGKLGICGLCGLGDFYLLSQVKLPALTLNNGAYLNSLGDSIDGIVIAGQKTGAPWQPVPLLRFHRSPSSTSNIYGRYEFTKSFQPIDIDEIVQELLSRSELAPEIA